MARATITAGPAGTIDAAWVAQLTRSESSLRRFLAGLPGVDQVGAEARAASLATRSIKAASKIWAIKTAISMVDLTTLEGSDTPGKVAALCHKARQPDPDDPGVPSVAAVCVYPDLVATAKHELVGSPVAAASVATAFPSGRASIPVKLADARDAVDHGADEVDMVIDRGAFLAGRFGLVLEEIRSVREICRSVRLKVILETGELVTYDNVRRASWLAMLGGADFIKTSTGKITPSATPPVALVMLEAVRDFAEAIGPEIGVKVAGGIRAAKDAIRYLVLVNEAAGPRWLDPAHFRFGASSLLNDLLMQHRKQLTGAYVGPDDYSIE